MTHILAEEHDKLRGEVTKFLNETHANNPNIDKLTILLDKWKNYEDAKCEYLTGIVQAVEKRVSTVNANLEAKITTVRDDLDKRMTETHVECTYRKAKGANFFEKLDYYFSERFKVSKWVIGAVSGSIMLITIFYLNQINTGISGLRQEFTSYRIEQSKINGELQTQARVNMQGISDLRQEQHERGVK